MERRLSADETMAPLTIAATNEKILTSSTLQTSKTSTPPIHQNQLVVHHWLMLTMVGIE